jgi:2-dehydropantoate 2-reductase
VEGERFDVVFLAVKSYDFEAACAQIAPYVDAQTVVVPLANGVDHRARIETQLERGVVCEGCVYIISHIEAPGVIRKKSPLFYMVFGREEITPKMEALAELLNESGLKTKLTPAARVECWKKYLFIATFATLTACHRLPMDAVYREHPDEVDAVLDEVIAVANALGVPLGEAEKAKVIKQAQNLPEGAKTSMQLDFEAGKRTELESLTGYVVHAAHTHGLGVPVMQRCYEALLEKRTDV